jgi:hypothetical protein
MKYQQLVVNGCSYMVYYATGQGHKDLADRVFVPEFHSLAKPGTCNTRIIRTTLKHSYQATVPSLYVIGLTFLEREELPIGKEYSNSEFEGRWINVQNGFLDQNFENTWSQLDCDNYLNLKVKIRMINNFVDRIEDLMYKVLSMIGDLQSRGHQALVFAQVAEEFQPHLDHPKLQLLKSTANIVDGLTWGANAWQIAQGVKTEAENHIPLTMRHICSGQHGYINKFLENYIQEHHLLK